MKKHTFPAKFSIICNDTLDFEELRELVKVCINNDVPIMDETLSNLSDCDYPYMFWDGDEETITQSRSLEEEDNDVIVVSPKTFLQYAKGEIEFTKPTPPITLKLNGSYKAVITPTEVKVGCQTFTFETITELYKAVQKQQRKQSKKS